MVIKCKYCDKEIEGVLPAPMTCWTCYRKLDNKSEIVNSSNNSVNMITTGETSKKCEKCEKILPITHFYKNGKEHSKLCKDCLVEESAKRSLNVLTVANLRKMSSSGVDSNYLSKDWGRTRSTCQCMMGSLVKTNYAYKKVVNGKNRYYMEKDLAERLINEKREYIPESNTKIPNQELVSNENLNKSQLKHVSGKGLYVKKVPIHILSELISDLRLDTGYDFNFKISTNGDQAEIFLAENQIVDWAKKTLKIFITKSIEENEIDLVED
jgi:hypothetical protein